MTGDAASCRSICHGVGWPSPAHAAPALASKIPKISAVALNRDKIGIALGSRRRAANHGYQIHVYRATARYRATVRPDAGRSRLAADNPTIVAQFRVQVRKIAIRITMTAITATLLFVSVTNVRYICS